MLSSSAIRPIAIANDEISSCPPGSKGAAGATCDDRGLRRLHRQGEASKGLLDLPVLRLRLARLAHRQALLLLGLLGLRTQVRPYANGEILRTLREIKSTGWRLEKRSWDLEAAGPGTQPEAGEPEAAA